MVEQINWIKNGKIVTSPFSRGKDERPIKITFHSEGLKGIDGIEAASLKALNELLGLPDIDFIYSNNDIPPYIRVDKSNNDSQCIRLQLFKDENVTNTFISNPSRFLEHSLKITNLENRNDPNVELVIDELIIAEAHCKFKYDILITMSEALLSNRHNSFLLEANVRKPSEAIKIIGLLLRARDNYCYYAKNNCNDSFDRGLFYWILGRHKLPSMWRYFSACVSSDNVRIDNILDLGQSILKRCVRALEARDHIGIQFYLPQNNNTRDRIMYHFDYLTLLLTGALDAQARVAHRAYKVGGLGEYSANFRKNKFIKALYNAGANDLNTLITDQRFQDVMTLLYELRNTIHGAGFPTLAVGSTNGSAKSFVTVLPEYQNILWEAAIRCGGTENWGFIKLNGLQLEPYTFAIKLLDECLTFIDKIANKTDVTKLFPTGYEKTVLMDGPPENGSVFCEDNRNKLNILY